MPTFEEFQNLAIDRLYSIGRSQESLTNFEFPPLRVVETNGVLTPFKVFGDLSAPNLVITATTHTTRLEDPSQQLRFTDQQTVLGPEYCLVAAQPYEPTKKPRGPRLKFGNRRQVAHGSFEPFAERVLGLIEELAPRDDQNVILLGFSLPADIMIEAAYQLRTNPNRGIAPIGRVAAYEPLRTAQRSRLSGPAQIVSAFNASGKQLHEHVLMSGSQALLEARQIDPESPTAEKDHIKSVQGAVTRYSVTDWRGNLAITRGFATEASLLQIQALANMPDAPRLVVGWARDSRIVSPEFKRMMRWLDGVVDVELPGDHSIIDNLYAAGAIALQGATA